jgi:hypothetical protein
MADNRRDLASFNTAINSKLRGCDLVCLKVRDVFAAGRVKERTSVTPSTRGKPVRFEITEATRQSLERRIAHPKMIGLDYLWPCRLHHSPRLSTKQYAWMLRDWVCQSVWSQALIARTRCDGRRWRSSTRRQAVCGRFGLCWITPRRIALFAIWALILMTR